MTTETGLALVLDRAFRDADAARQDGQVPRTILQDLRSIVRLAVELAPADLAHVVGRYPDVARLLPDRANPYR